MKLAMTGSGYVGPVPGACFADFGHDVVCVGKDENKISGFNKNIMPNFEPGLAELGNRNVEVERLSYPVMLGARS